MSTARQPLQVPSPCTGVCRMDEHTHWCIGCLRTLDEIAAWSRLSGPEKQEVWCALARRRGAAAGKVPPAE